MWKILPIFVMAMIMIYISDHNSIYELDCYGGRNYLRKEKALYFIMALMMAVFVGLRTNYNDTFAYRHSYELISNTFSLEGFSWDIGDNPGFNLLNRIMKSLGISVQNYLMFYALVTVFLYLWFIRKYSTNTFLSVFLFITMGCYGFSMAAIKQSVAIAICLVAVDAAIEKKWFKFVSFVLLASTFHAYSLMFFIVPLMNFAPWKKYSYWLLAIFGAAGVALQPLLGTVINITSMMGEEYTVASFSGEGVNPFRLIVVMLPVLLSFFARKMTRESEDVPANIFMNLAMLNAEIMFVGLFGTANYFARLANYFLIFQTLALPWVFKFFDDWSRKLLMIGSIGGYLVYYYYSVNIVYGSFDNRFFRLTLLEYFRTAF